MDGSPHATRTSTPARRNRCSPSEGASASVTSTSTSSMPHTVASAVRENLALSATSTVRREDRFAARFTAASCRSWAVTPSSGDRPQHVSTKVSNRSAASAASVIGPTIEPSPKRVVPPGSSRFTDELAASTVVTEPGMPAASANPLVAYYRAYSRLRAGLPADADFHAAAGKPTTYIFPNRPSTFSVLRAALQRDPTDATASFLLGSLYLSGGRIEPALEAWTAARRQNPRIPGLHRNLGLTYMIALDRPDQALEIFREGLDVDPQNIGLYVGIDQALSLTGGTATERAAALARYPDTANMPAAVSFKLALALAEAGRFDEADRIFVNRFFASEELGTNVRDVYLEVRLMRARDAARHQQCRDALAVIDRLADPVEGIPFTRDGLDAFLQSARRQQQIGEVEAACGRARPCSRPLARSR